MHGVSGAVGDHFAQDLLSDQCEVSDEVKDFVPHDSSVSPRAALLANASLANEFHKGPRAAIENWEFQIVEFDDRIVNPHSNQRGEQVFGGRNQHALLHQTGGVADAGHIPAYRLNLKTFEINTPKNN